MKELEFIEKHYPMFKNGTSNRNIRHNFFKEIKTELQAYLLGFIMSDGSINSKRNTLTIHINKKDSEIFELFKIISPEAYIQELKATKSTALVRGRTVKNQGSARLAISSKILIEDLKLLGILENKTYLQLSIPKMDDSLIRHFIRGYFDGDGSFIWYAKKPNPNNREINWSIKSSIQIDAKTENLLLEIQKWLSLKDIKFNINYLKRDDMYRLCTASKKQVLNFYNLIYNDSNYYLSRKFNKFNHYVNTEVTQLIVEYRNAQEMSVKESNNSPKSVGHPIVDENVR